jgi:hypothetical protein
MDLHPILFFKNINLVSSYLPDKDSLIAIIQFLGR